MEFGSAVRLLLRRWLVVLVGGALTLLVAGYVATSAAPSYRASANLLLLLPRDAADVERPTSPYLYLPTELSVLARLVADAVPGQEMQDSLAAKGLTSPYEVGVDPRSPIITVGVEGPDSDNVLATRDGLVNAIEIELAEVQLQEDVPPRQTARIRVFAADTTPTRLGGSVVRGVLAVVAAGGFLTLLAAFGIDRLLARRRSREPALSEPALSEPALTEPALTEPAPTEPPPTEPPPTQPALTEPALTERPPTEPAPIQRAPTQPAPTRPAPTRPAPTAKGRTRTRKRR
jgi:hypothetical protein